MDYAKRKTIHDKFPNLINQIENKYIGDSYEGIILDEESIYDLISGFLLK